MGAAIALRIASTRPDLVSALILARPAWLDAPRPDNMGPNRFVGELLRGYTKEDAREIFEKSLLAQRLAQEAPDNLVALRGFLRRDDVDVTRELLLRIPDDGPGLDRRAIATLRMPALVIGNGRDAVHPLEMARELAQLLPGAHFAEIVSKSDDRDRYREGFRTAVAAFLKDCTQ
jgi:pimeloyl-ACP methyl ester carboxylesterase